MPIKATVCGLLMAGLLSACGQPTDQQQTPRPLDTSMQKPPSADPSQPVSSGNTPTAADIAAAAALNAQYDPRAIRQRIWKRPRSKPSAVASASCSMSAMPRARRARHWTR